VTLAHKLTEHGFFVATAESLTAGLVSAELANTAGASKFLLGGIVSYQDAIKIQQLGVDATALSQRTAIDAEIAVQMAVGVRSKFASDCSKDLKKVIGISTTGVAGPDPVGNHPVGLVYLGIASAVSARSIALQLSGSRAEVRAATVAAALLAIEDEIHLLLG
jgi:nicotinamide-nucleotide amidase